LQGGQSAQRGEVVRPAGRAAERRPIRRRLRFLAASGGRGYPGAETLTLPSPASQERVLNFCHLTGPSLGLWPLAASCHEGSDLPTLLPLISLSLPYRSCYVDISRTGPDVPKMYEHVLTA